MIVDFVRYKRLRDIYLLEERMRQLILLPHGSADQMKQCFEEWFKKQNAGSPQ